MSDLAEQTALLKQHEGWLALNANHWLRLNPWLDFDDLMQEGRLALLRAHERFDPSANVKLLTFATICIQRAMGDHARCFAHPVKYPRQRGRTRQEVLRISFNECVFEGARQTWSEVLTTPEPDLEYSPAGELMALVEKALLKLTAKQQAVVKARFMEGRKLHDIGQELGVSRERIRQIESKALRLLRANRTLKHA